MKKANFSKKQVVLSIASFAIVLCGVVYLGNICQSNNAKSGGTATYADLSSFEKQKLEKEIELKEILRKYDKKNIVETQVYLGESDNEITNANIFIVSHEEIKDKDELVSLASESLNLDKENIYIESVDVESYASQGRAR